MCTDSTVYNGYNALPHDSTPPPPPPQLDNHTDELFHGKNISVAGRVSLNETSFRLSRAVLCQIKVYTLLKSASIYIELRVEVSFNALGHGDLEQEGL